MGNEEGSHELAIRSAVAMLTGAAGLLGPDAAAAATAVGPVAEVSWPG